MEDRVLDAPGLMDNYYSKLVAWSGMNCVAVGLGATVYLLDVPQDSTYQLMELPDAEDAHVTSLEWAPDDKHLAIGTSSGQIQLWDTVRSQKVW